MPPPLYGRRHYKMSSVHLCPVTWHNSRKERPRKPKVKIAMSHGASDRCWPQSLERKVPETSKLVSKIFTDATSNNVHQFQGQARLLLRLKVYHIYRTGRLRNFKTGTPCAINCMRYQMPWPAIKAYEVGLLHAGGGIPYRPHPAATQLVYLRNWQFGLHLSLTMSPVYVCVCVVCLGVWCPHGERGSRCQYACHERHLSRQESTAADFICWQSEEKELSRCWHWQVMSSSTPIHCPVHTQ